MLKPAYIDVTKYAAEVSQGFSIIYMPVIVTIRLWELCVEWSELDRELQTHQDINGRLFDILFTCGNAINRNHKLLYEQYRINFLCYVIPRDGQSTCPVEKSLSATISSGDTGLALVIDLA